MLFRLIFPILRMSSFNSMLMYFVSFYIMFVMKLCIFLQNHVKHKDNILRVVLPSSYDINYLVSWVNLDLTFYVTGFRKGLTFHFVKCKWLFKRCYLKKLYLKKYKQYYDDCDKNGCILPI